MRVLIVGEDCLINLQRPECQRYNMAHGTYLTMSGYHGNANITVSPNYMATGRSSMEWFGHVERRHDVDNTTAVAEMRMEGKRPRGRLRLKW